MLSLGFEALLRFSDGLSVYCKRMMTGGHLLLTGFLLKYGHRVKLFTIAWLKNPDLLLLVG